MNTYDDIYVGTDRTRIVLLMILMGVSLFYYSTQMFYVDAYQEFSCDQDCTFCQQGVCLSG